MREGLMKSHPYVAIDGCKGQGESVFFRVVAPERWPRLQRWTYTHAHTASTQWVKQQGNSWNWEEKAGVGRVVRRRNWRWGNAWGVDLTKTHHMHIKYSWTIKRDYKRWKNAKYKGSDGCVCFCYFLSVLVSPKGSVWFAVFCSRSSALPFWVNFSYVCIALHSLLSSFPVIFILPSQWPFGDGTIHFHSSEELTKPERLTDEAASWRIKTIF